MSMLSAQVDELRAMAESVGLAMPQAATLMTEAADTIWELRGSVHRERAEADRLRDERDTYRDLVDCMVHPDIPDQLAAENAKLRELVRDMWCDLQKQLMPPWSGEYEQRMRELGVNTAKEDK